MSGADMFAFEVWLKGHEEHRSVVNHRTLGKAKYAYLLDISDAFPDGLPFELVRARKVGPPQTSAGLVRTAAYRGRPELVAGVRVRVEGELGRIADSNSSANFDVLFDEDSRHCGAVLNVHPRDIEIVGESPTERAQGPGEETS